MHARRLGLPPQRLSHGGPRRLYQGVIDSRDLYIRRGIPRDLRMGSRQSTLEVIIESLINCLHVKIEKMNVHENIVYITLPT
jgi:hypothetical protein